MTSDDATAKQNYFSDEKIELTLDVIEQMRRNDPQIKGIELSFYDSSRADISCRHINAHKVDWTKMGEIIANSTHIKSLSIRGWDEGKGMDWEANCMALYKAIARNRSISSLILHGWFDFKFEDVLRILDPFFKHNSHLKTLRIDGDGLCNANAELLADTLSNCAISLHHFDILSWELDDISAGKIIASLAIHHTKLKTLDLHTVMGIDSCIELSKLLRMPNSKLENLDLFGCDIVDEGAIALGDALGENKSLKKLVLNDMGEVSSNCYCSLLRCLSNPTCSLEKIESNPGESETGIDDQVLSILADSLSSNTKLKSIDLNFNYNFVTNLGWRNFFDRLRPSNSSLEKLDLGQNTIDNTAVTLMVDSLASISSLRSLRLNDNLITSSGYIAISNLLRSPNCSLTNLQLGNSNARDNNVHVNDSVVASYMNALVDNNTLQTLTFGNYGHVSSIGRRWNPFINILCNKTSITSIVNSNHTLQRIYSYYPEDRHGVLHELNAVLQMNENINKVEVVRQKIIQYHFMDNIETLVGMELEMMPSAIAWIGRDNIGVSLLYHLAKNMPCLFDSEDKQKRRLQLGREIH